MQEAQSHLHTSETSSDDENTLEGYLSREQARDLSQCYAELKKKRKELYQYDESEWFTVHRSGQRETYHEGDMSSPTYMSRNIPPHIILYKSCLKEIIQNHMNFPNKTKASHDSDKNSVMDRLKSVIRREFRGGNESWSKKLLSVTDKDRREAGFLALKELQKKLSWVESKMNYNTTTGAILRGDKSDDEILKKNLVAKDVKRLPEQPASSYLHSGAYLAAHPLLSGCFSKSIICLLEHTENKPERETKSDISDQSANGGTYGIIVNKPLKIFNQPERDRTLGEVIRHDCLPQGVTTAFGECSVRNGGPVHVSVQMLRSTTPDEDEKLKLGGTLLSEVLNDDEVSEENIGADIQTEVKSTASNTDSAIYFAGDIIKASQAVIDNDMNKKSFSFVIGASCWEDGQLESEIEKGYWIPFSGPPQIAFSGACDIEGVDGVVGTESNLWVSVMSALGADEGRLAQMVENIDYDNNGLPCDEI